MSLTKSQLEYLDSAYGFDMSGKFTAGKKSFRGNLHKQIDALSSCDNCKDTGLTVERYQTKRGHWRSRLTRCRECK